VEQVLAGSTDYFAIVLAGLTSSSVLVCISAQHAQRRIPPIFDIAIERFGDDMGLNEAGLRSAKLANWHGYFVVCSIKFEYAPRPLSFSFSRLYGRTVRGR
jgi:hypothetical protein